MGRGMQRRKRKLKVSEKINAFHHKCQGVVAVELTCQDWYQTLLDQNYFTHHKKKSRNSEPL